MIPFPYQAAQAGMAGGGVSGTLWTPSNLGSLPFAWYNDASSMTLTGSAVDDWGDIGTGGFNLVQTVAADKPTRVAAGLNGRRTVLFDGSTDHLDTAGLIAARQVFKNTTAGYIFCVYKKTAVAGSTNQIIALNYTGTGGSRLTLAANSAVGAEANRARLVARQLDAHAAGQLYDTGSSGSTAWQMVLATMDWANGDGTLYIDGAQVAQNLALTSSGSTSNTDGSLAFSLGADAGGASAADIEVGEYLHDNYLPSGTEIDKLFGYLAHRWGLTANLPGGHPYKTTPPYV
jgi:hypothetical protein